MPICTGSLPRLQIEMLCGFMRDYAEVLPLCGGVASLEQQEDASVRQGVAV